MLYDYKVIPAPKKGRKARGVKGAEARFAHAIEEVMNDMGAEGWEFLRSETLPSEERQGLTASTTVFRSILVFRRPRADDLTEFQPELLEHHSAPETGDPVVSQDEGQAEGQDTLSDLPEQDWADEAEADRTRG